MAHYLLQACLVITAAASASAARLTLNVGTALTGTSSATLGVGLGHNHDPSSWAYLSRLGVNGARVFGGNGRINPRSLYGASFGRALDGSLVTDPGLYSAAIGNSIFNIVTALQTIGVEPLLVQWTTCGLFTFASDDNSTATYWGERWELYRHQYVLARWAWTMGVRRIEFWNEPDLNAPCMEVAGVTNARKWVEYYIVMSAAINSAFADLNADVASGFIPACPQSFLPCPLQPIVMASAFAAATFSRRAPIVSADGTDAYLGGPTVRNEHTVLPGYTQDLSVQNMAAYSFHTYGKSGPSLASTVRGLVSSVNAIHTPASAPLPVVVTEFSAHTSADWNGLTTTTETPAEMSDIASQVMYMAMGGYEAYLFKFSMTERTSGGVVKSGIHWADNTRFPFAIGGTTLTAEGVRLIVTAMVGSKKLETVTVSDASPNRPTAVVNDGLRRRLVFVNDGSSSSPSTDETLTINVAAWRLPAGTLVPVSLAAAGSHGEVSALLSVTSKNTLVVNSPANSVLTVTAPVRPTLQLVAAPLEDATITAGRNAATSFGTATSLVVSTSTTADHTSTSVALLKFRVPANAGPSALSSAILELTVQAAPVATMRMTILGVGCAAAGAAAWRERFATWNASAFAVSFPGAAVTSPSLDFVPVGGAGGSAGSVVAGHVTVAAGTAAGTVKRVDVTEFVALCGAGNNVTFAIARKMRNELFSGNAAGPLPADDLSRGARTFFNSKEANRGRPQLRFLLGTPAAAPATSLSAAYIAAHPAATGRRRLESVITASSVNAAAAAGQQGGRRLMK